MRRIWQQVTGLLFVLAAVPALPAGEAQNPQLNARSFDKLMRQALRSDRPSQTRVGIAFAKGEFVGQNASEAVRWFSKAAEAGYPSAQHNLAVMLYHGEGSKRNLRGSRP